MSMPISRTSSRLTTVLNGILKQYLHLQAAVNKAKAPRARYHKTLSEARRVRYYNTLSVLASLSDRDVNDIGIARASIRQIAKQERLEGANE